MFLGSKVASLINAENIQIKLLSIFDQDHQRFTGYGMGMQSLWIKDYDRLSVLGVLLIENARL